MRKLEYSASATKYLFWFKEFEIMYELLQDDLKFQEIKTLAVQNNILSASTPYRINVIFNVVKRRLQALPDGLNLLFNSCDMDTKRLINLVTIMNTELLFCEFMNDVYKEKLIIGDSIISDGDFRAFYASKREADPRVASWTDGSFERLTRAYKGYLTEAGLMIPGLGERSILRPILESSFEWALEGANLINIKNILTGAR